jgi:hypothetical protein
VLTRINLSGTCWQTRTSLAGALPVLESRSKKVTVWPRVAVRGVTRKPIESWAA